MNKHLPTENANCSETKLYRGQQITESEFDRIRTLNGEYLSINSFFSRSKSRDVALIYASILDYDNIVPILFEINIDRNVKSTKPYADIQRLSFFHDEEEILFMVGSNIDLQAKQLMQSVNSLHNQTKTISVPKVIEEVNSKLTYIRSNVNDSDDLGTRAHKFIENNRDELAIVSYLRALYIQVKQLPQDHPDIARILFNMAHCFVTLKNYGNGLQFITEPLDIRRKSLSSNHRDLALIELSAYNIIQLKHKKGKCNCDADLMSRYPVEPADEYGDQV
ncbi:unnamed protein product, partial [Didymodactylos carnosus]